MFAKVLAAALAASVLAAGASALPAESLAQQNSGGTASTGRKPKLRCKIPGTKVTIPRGGRKIHVEDFSDGTHTRDAYYCRQNGTLCYYAYTNGKLTKKSCTAARVVTPVDPRGSVQTSTPVTSAQGLPPESTTGAPTGPAGTEGTATTPEPKLPRAGTGVLSSGMAIAAG